MRKLRRESSSRCSRPSRRGREPALGRRPSTISTGGTITLDSEPGIGTSFEIHIPASESGAPQATKLTRAAPAGRGEAILIAEDDPAVRRVTSGSSAAPATTSASAGGAEALDLLDSPDRKVDLLLNDIVMPGTRGDDLAERAVAMRPGLPVLFMSGYSDQAPPVLGRRRAARPSSTSRSTPGRCSSGSANCSRTPLGPADPAEPSQPGTFQAVAVIKDSGERRLAPPFGGDEHEELRSGNCPPLDRDRGRHPQGTAWEEARASSRASCSSGPASSASSASSTRVAGARAATTCTTPCSPRRWPRPGSPGSRAGIEAHTGDRDPAGLGSSGAPSGIACCAPR